MVRYDFYDTSICYGCRLITKNGKFGFIDEEYKEIVPPIYDDAFEFIYECAIVFKGNLAGVIDTSGKLLIPLMYNHIIRINTKIFIVEKDNLLTIVNVKGKQLTQIIYDELTVSNHGKNVFVSIGTRDGYLPL